MLENRWNHRELDQWPSWRGGGGREEKVEQRLVDLVVPYLAYVSAFIYRIVALFEYSSSVARKGKKEEKVKKKKIQLGKMCLEKKREKERKRERERGYIFIRGDIESNERIRGC